MLRVSSALFALCGLLRVAHAKDCVDTAAVANQAGASDTAVTLCFDSGCWAFDVAAHTWATTSAPKPQPDKPDPPVVDNTKIAANLHVCGADGKDCHTADLPNVTGMYSVVIAQTPDRAHVFIQGQGDHGYLFDASRKVVATLSPWKTAMEVMSFRSAEFLDGNLALFEASSPITDEVRLYDGATGKLLGKVDTGVTGTAMELGDGEWAFWRIEHDDYAVANAKTGKLGKPITLRAAGVSDPAGSAKVEYRTTDKKQWLFARGDAASGVVVYDAATKKQTRYAPPACKK